MNKRTLGRRAALGLVSAVLAMNAWAAPAGRAMVGVWLGDVSLTDCASGTVVANFKTMQVFHAGGTLTDTSAADPSTRGPGMGVWSGRGLTYEARFRLMRFSGGSFVGWTSASRTIDLAEDGQTATGSIAVDIIDPLGNVLASQCGFYTSQRAD